MAFGLSKSISKQGGSTGVHTAKTQTAAGSGRGAGVVSTPGLGQDHAKNVNVRPAPKGGSGSTSAGGPKSY